MQTTRALTILVLVFLVFAASDHLGFAQAAAKRVAVLDLRNDAGLAQQDIDYLTEVVRTGARRALPTDRFILMTKENIYDLLPPERRNLASCEGQCEVETGRLLTADYLVTGAATKFAGELRVTIRLYEIAQGNLLESMKASALKVRQLEEPVESIAASLFTQVPGARRPVAAQPPSAGSPGGGAQPPPTPTPDLSGYDDIARREQDRVAGEKAARDARLSAVNAAYAKVKGYRESREYSREAKQQIYKKFLSDYANRGENPYYDEVNAWLSEPQDMVRIPAGAFTMGCVAGDGSCEADEKPAHRVSVNAFLMDEHEVTAADYEQCVRAGSCAAAKVSNDAKWAPFYNWGKAERRDHPVNGVDWNDANNYCRWAGKRLPTEAEFERALRGGNEGYINPWGNGSTPPARYGNYADESAKRQFSDRTIFPGYDDGYAGTSPVCSFTRNPYGLCDISGNVWEWCADWYDKDYYAGSPAENPKGAGSGQSRVLRGGSWDDHPYWERASDRVNGPPTLWDYFIGFRCVRD